VSSEELRRLPLISKQDIRDGFPKNFLREGMELEALLEDDLVELEQTSGTSEERIPLIMGRGWWVEQEERALRLNRLVSGAFDEFSGARRVTINSPICSGDIRYTGTPARSDRIVGNALFVSLSRFPFLWSEADLSRMAAEAAQWKPVFLDLDPVYGALFALYCERRGIRLPSLRFIIASYEFVSVTHRRILERVFGVPVFNLYGSTETGHLLMENERGEMKPSYDTAFLELVEADARGIGDLVVTTLTNDYMPLLRYRIGDLAEKHVGPYGSHFTVHGRVRDALASRDGQRVTTWQVDQCFAKARGVAHYELRQNENGGCVLRFVPDGAGPTEENLRAVTSQLETLLKSSAEIKAGAMPVLVPAASGKFRLTCRVAANPAT
jgi:phenylacetate-CoA ligase